MQRLTATVCLGARRSRFRNGVSGVRPLREDLNGGTARVVVLGAFQTQSLTSAPASQSRSALRGDRWLGALWVLPVLWLATDHVPLLIASPNAQFTCAAVLCACAVVLLARRDRFERGWMR